MTTSSAPAARAASTPAWYAVSDATFAWIVALLESVGAVLLILGILTRPIALGLAVDMLVAIVSVRIRMAKAPFASTQQVTGWELGPWSVKVSPELAKD